MQPMKKQRKNIHLWMNTLFGLAVFLFWEIAYPQALNYQEQNQLFLFNADYLLKDLSVAGGLADYISEFIVQFYYQPLAGAFLLGLLFVAMLEQTRNLIARQDQRWYIAGFIPPLLMLWHMGDIHTLLSFPIATIMALTVARTMGDRYPMADLILLPLLYWLAGPMVWVYALLRCFAVGWKQFWTLPYLAVLQVSAYVLLLSQWPPEMVLTGLNYYRIPLRTPLLQGMIPLSIVLLAGMANVTKGYTLPSVFTNGIPILSAAVLAGVAVNKGFDCDIYELLKQDEWVRKEQWTKIIERAEKHQVKTGFSSQCVNLALGMTGELPERMFRFYQSGSDALLMPAMNDNTSDLPTAEAFFRLGMINESLRYMSDIQQAILNFKGSGRCTKRIAECYLINGNYQAAAKHLALLRQSLFYRQWAKETATYLYRDDRIDTHPEWGSLRRNRYREQFLYNYEEKDKMLGILFTQNQTNRLALQYFMGQMLLDGNIESFVKYLPWAQQYGGHTRMPAGYADVMKCIQAKGNLPESDYARYAKRMNEKP